MGASTPKNASSKNVPSGFDWTRRKSGDVVITHHGREATVLRGVKADRFVADLGATDDDGQALMARLTGNYKRGNERNRSPKR